MVARTKSTIARFAGVSFHDGNGLAPCSAVAQAAQRNRPEIREIIPTINRVRATCFVFMANIEFLVEGGPEGSIDVRKSSRAVVVTPPRVRVRTRRFCHGPCGLCRRFGPSADGRRGFAPTLRHEGQQSVVFLPLVAHESRVVLAFSFAPLQEDRSGLPSCHRFGARRPFLSFGQVSCVSLRRRYYALCGLLPRGFVSLVSQMRCGPPEVSLNAFPARLPNLPYGPPTDMGFVPFCRLARSARPPIRFLYVRSQ